LLDKAAPLLEGADNDVKIQALSNMGFVYLKTERLDKAIDILNNGIDLAIKLKGEKCLELATFYHNLGRAYMLKKDNERALSALNKSKSLQLELEGNVMQRTIDYIKECQER
jgi:tetratricopeptide (TPR) repeat protein